jgi:hypothetical protein
VLSHSPTTPAAKRKSRGWPSVDLTMDAGARKRAKFWLGDKANKQNIESYFDDEVIEDPGDDEVDAEPEIDVRSPDFPYIVISDEDDIEEMDEDAWEREKSAVRAMSAEVVDTMEI